MAQRAAGNEVWCSRRRNNPEVPADRRPHLHHRRLEMHFFQTAHKRRDTRRARTSPTVRRGKSSRGRTGTEGDGGPRRRPTMAEDLDTSRHGWRLCPALAGLSAPERSRLFKIYDRHADASQTEIRFKSVRHLRTPESNYSFWI